MKPLPLLLSFFVLGIGPTARAAPPERPHSLGLAFGYARSTILDQAASSLAYRAHLATGSLAYVGERRTLRWGARVGTGFGHLAAASYPGRSVRFEEIELDGARDVVVVPMRGSIHTPSAEVSLERRFDFGALSLLAGAAARFEVAYVQGFTTPGLMQLFSLRPSLVARRVFGEAHTLELGLRTTVLGFRTRMPYHQSVSQPNTSPYRGLVRQGSDLRTIDELQTIELELRYQHAFGAHGALRATLGVDWLHDADPRHLFAATSRGALALLYRF